MDSAIQVQYILLCLPGQQMSVLPARCDFNLDDDITVFYGFLFSGDHWIVVCSGKTWRRDQSVRFKHLATQ